MRIKEIKIDLGGVDFDAKLESEKGCLLEIVPLSVVKALKKHINDVIFNRTKEVNLMAKAKATKPAVKKPATKAKAKK